LREGEIGLNADQTGVYSSEGLFGSGETNPLVITFSSPVSGFSIMVANGDVAQSYTVADDLGDSESYRSRQPATRAALSSRYPATAFLE
jgi:hypothetical protein